MQKILLIMYYIWMIIMLITGIWLLYDICKILILLMIDKIRSIKENRKEKKANRKIKMKMKTINGDPYEYMRRQNEMGA